MSYTSRFRPQQRSAAGPLDGFVGKPYDGPVEVLSAKVWDTSSGWGYASVLVEVDVPDPRDRGATRLQRLPCKVVGCVKWVYDGATADVRGAWVRHPKHGVQIDAATFFPRLDPQRHATQAWLEHYIPEIGPVRAGALVDTLRGPLLWKALEDRDIDALKEAPGIGDALAASVCDAYAVLRHVRTAHMEMATLGIDVKLAEKAIARWGSASVVERLKDNPYILGQIAGWQRADQIARNAFGIAATDERRVKAGLLEAAYQSETRYGHVCRHQNALLQMAEQRILHVSGRLVREVYEKYADELFVRWGPRRTYRVAAYAAEYDIASGIRRCLGVGPREDVGEVVGADGITLDPVQQDAVKMILRERVSVLTGGPGTGKTTTLRTAVRLLRAQGDTVALAAPTGKAARRMQEACGYMSSTLHRLLRLGFDPSEADEDDSDVVPPIEADVVIVDEASMLDVWLMAELVRRVHESSTRLVFVGDVEQLPSVGPGRIFADLIDSGVVPVTRLQTLHRAAAEFWVSRNAPRVLAGEELELGVYGADFTFIDVSGYPARAAVDMALTQIGEYELDNAVALAGAVGSTPSDALEHMQILAPQKGGALGVEYLNACIQSMVQGDYAADREAFRVGDLKLWQGDKVLQTRNNYQLGVMNGETGVVVGTIDNQRRLLVRFDEREVEYEKHNAYDLQLGYVTTIHKAQGSEWPLVVVFCHSAYSPNLLQRRTFYTAITRAKKRLVLVGDREGIDKVVRNTTFVERETGLADQLRENA